MEEDEEFDWPPNSDDKEEVSEDDEEQTSGKDISCFRSYLLMQVLHSLMTTFPDKDCHINYCMVFIFGNYVSHPQAYDVNPKLTKANNDNASGNSKHQHLPPPPPPRKPQGIF